MEGSDSIKVSIKRIVLIICLIQTLTRLLELNVWFKREKSKNFIWSKNEKIPDAPKRTSKQSHWNKNRQKCAKQSNKSSIVCNLPFFYASQLTIGWFEERFPIFPLCILKGEIGYTPALEAASVIEVVLFYWGLLSKSGSEGEKARLIVTVD